MEPRLGLIVTFCVFVAWWLQRTYRLRNLPPGPRGIPFIGNIFDLPSKGVPEYEHWLHHKDRYGPLSSVTVLGQTLVIVHDKAAADDLLEKATKKTAGRPYMEFALNLCGFKKSIAMRPHDTLHHGERKLISLQFGSASWAARFEAVQKSELIRFVKQVHNSPEDLMKLLKAAIGAMILRTAYGYHAKTASQDPLIASVEQLMKNFSAAAMPMAWTVDAVPILRYLPAWLPGASFQRIARRWQRLLEVTARVPFQFAVRRMQSGEGGDSFVSRALRQDDAKNPLERLDSAALHDVVKWSAATLYSAGTDTTMATLKSFILAMVKYPQVQTRAQAELDTTIGTSRLPKLGDRPNLPYIDAVVKEVYRWHPAGPLSLPHKADEAIDYGEYHIPRGSYLSPSVRWFFHDPKTHTSPHIFDPSRFLYPRHEPDPRQVAFGYGRRSCLGRQFADAIVFQAVTLLLATFNIEKAVDSSGRPIDVAVESTTGLIDHVKPFAYKLTARNPTVIDLLQDTQETTVDDSAQIETDELLSAIS